MLRLKRKIDDFLVEWKNSNNKLPLIVKGARQIGKTYAIENFAKSNYKSVIEINFVLQPEFKDIFNKGFEIDRVIKDITLKNGDFHFISGDTLIFFDEIQDYPSCATALKAFREDGRFDVICSGSLMGINYEEIESNSVGNKIDYIMHSLVGINYEKIESNSVGNKIDYTMHSLDFEEFLWAKGYNNDQIEDMYQCMKKNEPLSKIQYDVMMENFNEYMIVGGMPLIVKTFIENKTYNGILEMQKQIILGL